MMPQPIRSWKSVCSVVDDFWSKHADGVVVIRWATATGKTALSVALADRYPLEVVSSDSRQVFIGMDVGTDKVSKTIREKLPHHCMDVVRPDEKYTAWQWQQDAYAAIQSIHDRNKQAVVAGGTGLYIDTLYKNYRMPYAPPQPERRAAMMQKEENDPGFLYQWLQQIDPVTAARLHPNALRYILRALEIYEITGQPKSIACGEQEVDYPLLMLGLRREKEDAEKRIVTRIQEMIESELAQEVQGLLDQWYGQDLQSMQGIGYKETVRFLQGSIDKQQRQDELEQATLRLAKRQRSRFRRYLRDAIHQPKKKVQYACFDITGLTRGSSA